MDSFRTSKGGLIVERMIKAIQDNAVYLSEIDGAIGDGDHGINMNKGFTAVGESLTAEPGGFAHSLKVLSRALIMDIGGSMGPLYGSIFKAMAKIAADREQVNAGDFRAMLESALEKVQALGGAGVGDKTMVDTLVPAAEAYGAALDEGADFKKALERMKTAAEQGRDSTKDMVARLGRSSRLEERSRGVLDAGATSCCIILCTAADTIIELLDKDK